MKEDSLFYSISRVIYPRIEDTNPKAKRLVGLVLDAPAERLVWGPILDRIIDGKTIIPVSLILQEDGPIPRLYKRGVILLDLYSFKGKEIDSFMAAGAENKQQRREKTPFWLHMEEIYQLNTLTLYMLISSTRI